MKRLVAIAASAIVILTAVTFAEAAQRGRAGGRNERGGSSGREGQERERNESSRNTQAGREGANKAPGGAWSERTHSGGSANSQFGKENERSPAGAAAAGNAAGKNKAGQPSAAQGAAAGAAANNRRFAASHGRAGRGGRRGGVESQQSQPVRRAGALLPGRLPRIAIIPTFRAHRARRSVRRRRIATHLNSPARKARRREPRWPIATRPPLPAPMDMPRSEVPLTIQTCTAPAGTVRIRGPGRPQVGRPAPHGIPCRGTRWLACTATAVTSPLSYNYGNNVNYQNGNVMVAGQSVGTAEQYSQQAYGPGRHGIPGRCRRY